MSAVFKDLILSLQFLVEVSVISEEAPLQLRPHGRNPRSGMGGRHGQEDGHQGR